MSQHSIQSGDDNQLASLPPDVLIEIVSQLPIEDIRRLCRRFPSINAVICQSPDIWRRLFRRDISTTFVPENGDYRQAYIEAEFRGGYHLMEGRRWTRREGVKFECTDPQSIATIISHGYDQLFLRLAAECRQLYPDWKLPVHRYGDLNWNEMIRLALESNNPNLIQALIQMYADEYRHSETPIDQLGIPYSVVINHRLDLLKQLLEAGVDPNDFVNTAILNGQIDALDLLAEHGADLRQQANKILLSGAVSGNRDLVDLAIDLGATNIDEAINRVVQHGHDVSEPIGSDIIKRLLPLTHPSKNLNLNLELAAKGGKLPLVKSLLPYSDQRPWTLRRALQNAYYYDKFDVAKYLLSVGATWFPSENEEPEEPEENEEPEEPEETEENEENEEPEEPEENEENEE